MNQRPRNPVGSAPAKSAAPSPARPRESWRPKPRVRPCLRCNKPRISTSPGDRLHPGCRPQGELNDGEAASLVR